MIGALARRTALVQRQTVGRRAFSGSTVDSGSSVVMRTIGEGLALGTVFGLVWYAYIKTEFKQLDKFNKKLRARAEE